MNIRKKLSRQLLSEFGIRPDIIDTVVGLTIDGTIEEATVRILKGNKSLSRRPDRAELVYKVLLKLGREICNDENTIAILRKNIDESIKEVRAEKLTKKSMPPNNPPVLDGSNLGAASFFSTRSVTEKSRVEQKKLKKRAHEEEAIAPRAAVPKEGRKFLCK